MFLESTISAFKEHVRSLRADEARERARRKAESYEAKLARIERQTISVWRVENGHPVEIIHRR
jgi:septation ring formation regulator EzrA